MTGMSVRCLARFVFESGFRVVTSVSYFAELCETMPLAPADEATATRRDRRDSVDAIRSLRRQW